MILPADIFHRIKLYYEGEEYGNIYVYYVFSVQPVCCTYC